jgi:AcrR family transcriptional regulator
MPRIAAAQRAQHAAGRRQEILDAALRVFSEGGFSETTMDQVAARAGVSKGSLYLYFPSKQSLLEGLMEHFSLLPELPDIVHSLKRCAPPRGIPLLVTQLWTLLRERKELARVLVREIQSNPERGRIYTEQAGMRASRVLAGYLEIWMERKELRALDPLVTAQALLGMLWYFLLTQDVMGGREVYALSDAQIISTVTQVFLEGTLPHHRANRSSRPRPAPLKGADPRR